MKKTIRKIALISILTAGTLGLIGCGKADSNTNAENKEEARIERQEKKEDKINTLGDVLKYIDNNPQNQELIINYSIAQRKDNDLDFSKETIDNLADIVKIEVEVSPLEMKDYVLDISRIGLSSEYRNEIWQQLSKEEKWEIFKEASKYKAKECWKETKEIAKDAGEKFKETELYDKLRETGKEIKESGKDLGKKAYEKLKGEN